MRKYKVTVSEKEFLGLLHDHYRLPSYAVLKQVPVPVVTSDARNRIRKADALVIGTLETREACIIGFEMKSDRTSWVQELATPRKAEDMAQFCDYWYILAYEDVVLEKDVPLNWGLYIAKGGKLKLVKPAKKLTPKEPTRELFFSIFQALVDQFSKTPKEIQLSDEYSRGRREGAAEARQIFGDTLQRIRDYEDAPELKRLRKIILNGPGDIRFKRAAMAERLMELFSYWNSLAPTENAIAAVEFIADGGLKKVSSQLHEAREKVSEILESINENISSIDETVLEGFPVKQQEPINTSTDC